MKKLFTAWLVAMALFSPAAEAATRYILHVRDGEAVTLFDTKCTFKGMVVPSASAMVAVIPPAPGRREIRVNGCWMLDEGLIILMFENGVNDVIPLFEFTRIGER